MSWRLLRSWWMRILLVLAVGAAVVLGSACGAAAARRHALPAADLRDRQQLPHAHLGGSTEYGGAYGFNVHSGSPWDLGRPRSTPLPRCRTRSRCASSRRWACTGPTLGAPRSWVCNARQERAAPAEHAPPGPQPAAAADGRPLSTGADVPGCDTLGMCPARCRGTRARSSTDRASDYGSEGWGFESLRARPSDQRFHSAGVSEKVPLTATVTATSPDSAAFIRSAASRSTAGRTCE